MHGIPEAGMSLKRLLCATRAVGQKWGQFVDEQPRWTSLLELRVRARCSAVLPTEKALPLSRSNDLSHCQNQNHASPLTCG